MPSAPGKDPIDAPVVRFEHVSMRYHSSERDAVDDFTFTCPAGRTTVLVGSSGCGKTTLLRMVNAMVKPTSGRVLIDERDVATTAPVGLRRSIGYVMQNSGLLPHRRVIDNIATVPRLNGVSSAEAHRHARELMSLVGLEPDLASRWPVQLSGGQQQRVGVARALAGDPKLLLMDEPFGAVDPIVRADLQRDLAALQARLNKTIIFVTHDVGEAFTLGDQIVILQVGARIAQQGTPREVVATPANEFVARFIGLDAGAGALHVERTGGHDLVVDARGRPLGRLAGETA